MNITVVAIALQGSILNQLNPFHSIILGFPFPSTLHSDYNSMVGGHYTDTKPQTEFKAEQLRAIIHGSQMLCLILQNMTVIMKKTKVWAMIYNKVFTSFGRR